MSSLDLNNAKTAQRDLMKSPRGEPASLGSTKTTAFIENFVLDRAGLAPYVLLRSSSEAAEAVHAEDEPLPLTRVKCGPSNLEDSVVIASAVEERLLKAHDLSEVPVDTSDVPYRF